MKQKILIYRIIEFLPVIGGIFILLYLIKFLIDLYFFYEFPKFVNYTLLFSSNKNWLILINGIHQGQCIVLFFNYILS